MENELIIELEEDIIDISVENEKDTEMELENSDLVPTGSVGDYKKLENKPRIEGVELEDDKTFKELGLITLTNLEIENLINKQM